MTEEIIPMHIVGGKGQVSALLRWCGQEPPMSAQRAVYLYESGEGLSDYGEYDHDILTKALAWIEDNADGETPWTLIVSFACPHPPFKTPQRFLDLYPVDDMPLPQQAFECDHPTHPALLALRESKNYRDMWEPDSLRKIAASYFALISMVDEKVGTVLNAVEDAGVMQNTRIVYTSDHGECLGAHGLFGKSSLYEEAIGVPLIMMGPDIPSGRTVTTPVSHVDLFPTLVAAGGAILTDEDSDLSGRSLFDSIGGLVQDRPIFAEYHATGSKSGSFMLRDGGLKLIYHVGMPAQVFDLQKDPMEQHDLAQADDGKQVVAQLTEKLRRICDPEEVDRRAKRDQETRANEAGGVEEILKSGVFKRSPVPGRDADYSV